jgi:HK97 gp10 family phage protein
MRIKININTKISRQETLIKLQKALFKSMLKMHELATKDCPVDTGRLKGTINIEPKRLANKYILGVGTDYGVYVEFGTYKMNAQPFMRPALKQVKDIWLKRNIKDEFK